MILVGRWIDDIKEGIFYIVDNEQNIYKLEF